MNISSKVKSVADSILTRVLFAEAQNTCVGITQVKDAYRGNPTLTYRAMKGAIQALRDKGLINFYPMPPTVNGCGVCSFARASPKLIEELDVEALAVMRPKKSFERLLKWQDKQRRQFEIPSTKRACRLRAEMIAQNDFMDSCVLGFSCPLLQTLTPTIACCRQQRIFARRSDGRLAFYSNGGRMYGAGYQCLKKECRPEILINEKTTVEEDFSQCHIVLYRTIFRGWTIENALAHKAYEFEVDNAPYHRYLKTSAARRRFQKVAVMIMINAANLRLAKSAAVWELQKVAPTINRERALTITNLVFEAVKETNPEIPFFSDLGVLLQSIDAEISSEIQRQGRLRGIPVLNIHDGFRVQEERAGWLKDTMEETRKRIIHNRASYQL